MKTYTVKYRGKEIYVKEGENLRKSLLRNGFSPYNGAASYLNCQGLGSCGTCALAINGDAGPRTSMEKWRLNFPPHKTDSELRLACQVKVRDDLELIKYGGFWGHKLNEKLTE